MKSVVKSESYSQLQDYTWWAFLYFIHFTLSSFPSCGPQSIREDSASFPHLLWSLSHCLDNIPFFSKFTATIVLRANWQWIRYYLSTPLMQVVLPNTFHPTHICLKSPMIKITLEGPCPVWLGIPKTPGSTRQEMRDAQGEDRGWEPCFSLAWSLPGAWQS